MSILRSLLRAAGDFAEPYIDDVIEGGVKHASRMGKSMTDGLDDILEGIQIHAGKDSTVVFRAPHGSHRYICLKVDPLRLSRIGPCSADEFSLGEALGLSLPFVVAFCVIYFISGRRSND